MGVENEAQFRNRDGIIDDAYRIAFISEHLYYAAGAGAGQTVTAICCGPSPTMSRR